ncbi:putative protein kinase [Trypanosoma rangeli]|uniref:Protein kinase domain-containing protein n=1 Tax=Trypanosoma rangeli TaxID=5698 RepID=A0A422NHU6_TRYRA|nr:putative protein kinase [Trypanosoma rangeli]RNF05019.1 putative protein kinase [Trypanosoma rangeli]|eukprot:RNF05019.1 putative protein kinase [Trypanosoma rangeli]
MPYRKQIVGKYELGKVLASGYFDCRTRLCTHIVTGAQYAVRIYNKSVLAEAQWMWDRTRGAIHVMRTLPKHDNIIETVECFETQTSLYILMQLFAPMQITRLYTTETATGQRVLVPMQQTKHYYAQVVRGLLHMHSHNVVHLGLAPDHVMVNDRDQVKIGYLVSCTYFPKGKLCYDIRGTTHTVAPEVLQNGGYDPYLADAWSMGVLLYFMLNQGRYPHDGANTTKNIMYNRIRPPDPNLPPEAKDLLARLLHPTPSRRMRVQNIMSHPFFATNHGDTDIAEGCCPARTVGTSPETRYSPDLATGESTLNIRIPYGLSRQEEAAYIIQHTYRAYLARKRQQLLVEKSALAKAAAERNRKIGCRSSVQGSVSGRVLRQFQKLKDEQDPVTLRAEKRESPGLVAPPSPDIPLFDDAIVVIASGSDTLREDDESLALLSEGPEAALTSVTPSTLEQAGKTSYEAFGTRPRKSALGGGGASLRRGGIGRPMMASLVQDKDLSAGVDEKNLETFAAFVSNVEVDPTRPCPVCHRLPMQRLCGRAPYLNTPFVYKQGEFIRRVEDD